MKKHLWFFTSLFIVASLNPVVSQKLKSNTAVTGVCYAGNKVNRIYIPPPADFFKKSAEKGGASITVKYTTVFPSSAEAAVEYAVSILETILPADTKITIAASWEIITTSGVLANSSTTGYMPGWSIDAQNPLAAYPVALAEKIAGKSLNDSLADITLRINRSINWYLGTDGNTTSQRYDLVTVVLHEVCHGLGFFDSMNTDNTIGWYGIEFGIDNGIDTLPLIYDTFIENGPGDRLTDTLVFKNFSADLRGEITGGDLYFSGPLLNTYTSGPRAPIYSPPIFDPGSSISHLDEDQTLEPNTLMTPFIDKGEAIHDPGKLTLSILGDLGWINTRIIHKASHDTEENLNELPLSIRIASDTLYKHDSIGVVFSYDRFATRNTLIMTSQGSDDIYNCSLSVPHYNSEIQYYFFAQDCFKRIYRSPSLSDSLHSIYIGIDTVRPVVSHTPLTSFLEKVDTINFIATVTDNLGVDTVFTEYKLNDGPLLKIGLKSGKDNIYSALLDARSLLLKGGDSIQYRIIAADSAKLPNSTVLPDSGYYTIHIESLMTTLTSYSTDFSGDASDDFINNGFEIYKPSGFNRYGLNSRHPYESPEDNDKTIESTSILRHPLKFNESGLVISFNEVVLVEPGETGSIFGSDEFWDYVILEGSKNFGKKWFRLADGYDSRLLKTWETAYKGSINEMGNSTAIGKESMLNKHTIFYTPSDNISAGDTLLLRFRLFSDPFANGWGWVIEDLKLSPLIDAVEKVHSDGSVIVFPNPGHGLLRIRTGQGSADNGKPVRCNIFNTSGICIMSDYLEGDMENVIDISDHQTGIYIIVLNCDYWIKTIKYSLIK
jgi:hypothetical protein